MAASRQKSSSVGDLTYKDFANQGENNTSSQRSRSMLDIRKDGVNGDQEDNNPPNDPPHGFFDGLKHIQDKIAAILSMLKISAILSALVNACIIGANLDFAKIITSWTPYAQFLAPYLIPVTLIGIIADSFVSLLCFNKQNDSLWSIPQHMMTLLGASAALATSFLLPAIAPCIMAGVLGFISLAYFAKALKNVANNPITKTIKNILFGVGLACTTVAFAAAFIFSAPAWVSIVFPAIAVTSIVLALSITVAKLGRRFFGKKEMEVPSLHRSVSVEEEISSEEENYDKQWQCEKIIQDYSEKSANIVCVTFNQLDQVQMEFNENGLYNRVKPNDSLIMPNLVIMCSYWVNRNQNERFFKIDTLENWRTELGSDWHNTLRNQAVKDDTQFIIVFSKPQWQKAGFYYEVNETTGHVYMNHPNNESIWNFDEFDGIKVRAEAQGKEDNGTSDEVDSSTSMERFLFLKQNQNQEDHENVEKIKECFSKIIITDCWTKYQYPMLTAFLLKSDDSLEPKYFPKQANNRKFCVASNSSSMFGGNQDVNHGNLAASSDQILNYSSP